MAKLSARGRTEIWRAIKVYFNDVTNTENRVKYARMSDGRTLKNTGNGWKVVKVKKELDNVEGLKEFLRNKGYQIKENKQI